MSIASTILHVQGCDPAAVERALDEIFAREERPQMLRLEGTYSAVLARALSSDLAASYRYVVCRPHASSSWTPLLELGNRTDGLDCELSRVLGGAPVFTTFTYGDGVSGYRLARDGALVDRYVSDPLFFAEGGAPPETTTAPDAAVIEEMRGHPERFADLLPAGTRPDDFARVVLRPGWWETHDLASGVTESDEDEWVDEADRMRCIGLALEFWAPDEYPFARELEEIPNKTIGPALALAYA